jgi:catechol 2,3-dioxygenase-like lactoylglutathione lyase family enzyme
MIRHLDHLVLTTARLDDCLAFYCDGLGMTLEKFIGGTPPVERLALKFGTQKINIHVKGKEFEPKAALPTPGALDLCFIASQPLDTVIANLQEKGLAIIEGPVARTGATGKIRSVYLRDPDENLIEISEYLS